MASEIKGGNIWKNDILWMEEDSIEILQLMVEKYPMIYPFIPLIIGFATIQGYPR